MIVAIIGDPIEDDLRQFIGGIMAEVAGRRSDTEAHPAGRPKDQVGHFTLFDSTHAIMRT